MMIFFDFDFQFWKILIRSQRYFGFEQTWSMAGPGEPRGKLDAPKPKKSEIINVQVLRAPVRVVGVLGSLWKHQQSRDLTFLHRSCTQLFFSTPKKILFFGIQNIFRNIFRSKIFFVIFRKSKNFVRKKKKKFSFATNKIWKQTMMQKVLSPLKNSGTKKSDTKVSEKSTICQSVENPTANCRKKKTLVVWTLCFRPQRI